MNRHPEKRLLAVLALVLGLAAGACKTTSGAGGKGLGPNDAARARPNLLARISVAPLDRTFAKAEALAKQSSLPLTADALRVALLARAGLPPEFLTALDNNQPIGTALYALQKHAEPSAVFAAAARSPDAAANLIRSLGTTVETRAGAQRVTLPDRTSLWLLTHAGIIIGSRSLDALLAAGALALEARVVPPDDDVLVTAFPDALLRWQETDIKSAMAIATKEALDEQRKTVAAIGLGAPTASDRAQLQSALDQILPLAGQISTVEIGLGMGPTRGVELSLRLQPRPGTAFATQVATRTPFQVPSALLGDARPLVLAAVGPSPFLRQLAESVAAAQARAGDKDAAEISRLMQSWWAANFTGAISARVGSAGNQMVLDIVIPLLPTATPGAVLDGLVAFTRAHASMLRASQGRGAPDVKVRRDGDVVRTEISFRPQVGASRGPTAIEHPFGSAMVSLASVSGGHLVIALEPGAKARMGTLGAAGSPVAPPPELAAALGDSRGREGFAYVDLMGMVRLILTAAPPAGGEGQMLTGLLALPTFADLKLPVLLTYEGGARLSARLRVPGTTLATVGGVLSMFNGMGLGGALTPQQGP